MSDRPEQRPEGRLIALAMKRKGYSNRKAAELAGISEGRWRQIVSGSQSVTTGVWAPVVGPPETLARMARVVNVAADELDEAGRPDAAEELRQLQTESKRSSDETADRLESRYHFKERFAAIQRMLDEQDDEVAAARLDMAFRIIEEEAS